MLQTRALLLLILSLFVRTEIVRLQASDDKWVLLTYGRAELESQNGVLRNVHLPNNSIVDVDFKIMKNIQALGIVSHASEIHFHFDVEENLTLRLNSTMNTLQYSTNEEEFDTFQFGGFAKLFFKGKCNKWNLDFGDISSQLNHTITFGRNIMGNMTAIESENSLFGDVFLEVSSELNVFGGDAHETFSIHNLQPDPEKSIPKLTIFGGNGIDSTVFVNYGPYGCPLNVDTDSITVNSPVICFLDDEISFKAEIINIFALLQTDRGAINILHSDALPGSFSMNSAVIFTNADLVVNVSTINVESSMITAASVDMFYLGPDNSLAGGNSVNFITVEIASADVSIIGPERGIYCQSLTLNECSNFEMNGTAVHAGNGLFLRGDGIAVSGPVVLSGVGQGIGIFFDVASVVGTSINLSGTAIAGTGLYFEASGCVLENVNIIEGTGDIGISIPKDATIITTGSARIEIRGRFDIIASDALIDASKSPEITFVIICDETCLQISNAHLSLIGITEINATVALAVQPNHNLQIFSSIVESASPMTINIAPLLPQNALYGVNFVSPTLVNVTIDVTRAETDSNFSGVFNLDSVSVIFHFCDNLSLYPSDVRVSKFFRILLDSTSILTQGYSIFSFNGDADLYFLLEGVSSISVSDVDIFSIETVFISTTGPFEGTLSLASVNIGAHEIVFDISATTVDTLFTISDGFMLLDKVRGMINSQGAIFSISNWAISIYEEPSQQLIVSSSSRILVPCISLFQVGMLRCDLDLSVQCGLGIALFDVLIAYSIMDVNVVSQESTLVIDADITYSTINVVGSCTNPGCTTVLATDFDIYAAQVNFVRLESPASSGIAFSSTFLAIDSDYVFATSLYINATGYNSALLSGTVTVSNECSVVLLAEDSSNAKAQMIISDADITVRGTLECSGNSINVTNSQFRNYGTITFTSTDRGDDAISFTGVGFDNMEDLTIQVNAIPLDLPRSVLEITGCTFGDSLATVASSITMVVAEASSKTTFQDSTFFNFGGFNFSSPGSLELIRSNITCTSTVYVLADAQIDTETSFIYALEAAQMTLISNLITFTDFIHPNKTGGFINIQSDTLRGNLLDFGAGMYEIMIYGNFQLNSTFIAQNSMGSDAAVQLSASTDSVATSIFAAGGIFLNGTFRADDFVEFPLFVTGGQVVISAESAYFGIISLNSLTVMSKYVYLSGNIATTGTAANILFNVSDVMDCQSTQWISNTISLVGQGFVHFTENIMISATFQTQNPLIGSAESLSFLCDTVTIDHSPSNFTGVINFLSGNILFSASYLSASITTRPNVILMISESVRQLNSTGSMIIPMNCISIPEVNWDNSTTLQYTFQAYPDACPDNSQLISSSFSPNGAILLIVAEVESLPPTGDIELVIVSREDPTLTEPDDFFSNLADKTVVGTYAGRSLYIDYNNSNISLRNAPTAQDDLYFIVEGGILDVPAPGVLANDNSNSIADLSAVLVDSVPGLTLFPNGQLTYVSSSPEILIVNYFVVNSLGITSGKAIITIDVFLLASPTNSPSRSSIPSISPTPSLTPISSSPSFVPIMSITSFTPVSTSMTPFMTTPVTESASPSAPSPSVLSPSVFSPSIASESVVATSMSQSILPTPTTTFEIQLATILPPQPPAPVLPSPSTIPLLINQPQISVQASITPTNTKVLPLTNEPLNIALENDEPIVLQTEDGETIAISIPDTIDGQIITVQVVELIDPPERIASPILSITMFDAFGNEVDKFGDPVELCFTDSSGKISDKCLGYYDSARSEWVCEDLCLKKSNKLVCGTSNHFTNFAILLGASGGSCGGDNDTVIAWLSLAFIALALVVVVIALVVLEIRMRIKISNETNQWTMMEKKTTNAF